jgi:sigma-E factor negative regulatory protein RseC
MSNKIKHSGQIDRICEHHIQVRIVQTSACASCKVASHCGASDKRDKLIHVFGDFPNLQEGDQVTLVATTQMGMRAVALGYGIPLVLMVVVLIAGILTTGNEPLSALASLACLIPYYILLYAFRNKLSKKLSFTIEN